VQSSSQERVLGAIRLFHQTQKVCLPIRTNRVNFKLCLWNFLFTTTTLNKTFQWLYVCLVLSFLQFVQSVTYYFSCKVFSSNMHYKALNNMFPPIHGNSFGFHVVRLFQSSHTSYFHIFHFTVHFKSLWSSFRPLWKVLLIINNTIELAERFIIFFRLFPFCWSALQASFLKEHTSLKWGFSLSERKSQVCLIFKPFKPFALLILCFLSEHFVWLSFYLL
jgi:hypothetical protein